MNTWLGDLRYSLRQLRKGPAFTLVVVLSLALGIGGNAVVFSWMQSVLLESLPGIRHASRLVALETVLPDGSYHTSSYPDFKDYRAQSRSYTGLIGCELVSTAMRLPGQSQARDAWGLLVTENYFDVLGVQARLGRTFHAVDEQGGPGSDAEIVLSHRFWLDRFAGDAGVVGRQVEINHRSFTVIGVTPAGFRGTIVGVSAGYFVPMMMQPVVLPGDSLTYRAPTFVHILGMRKPGVSVVAAAAEARLIAARLAREYPLTNHDIGMRVVPIWRANYGLQSFLLPVLGFLGVIALLVLLIACANVANLMLARVTVREKEMAIRTALGAGRVRLARQLLIESLLLSLLGGGAALLIALRAPALLTHFLPPGNLPIGVADGGYGRLLLFVLAFSALTAVLFGLAPALQAARGDVAACLNSGERGASTGTGRHRVRDLLVMGEVVLAMVLLIGAGLLARSLSAARQASPGFTTRDVLLTRIDLRGRGYTDAQAAEFYGQLLHRVSALPGVRAASLERSIPLWFTGESSTRPTIAGYTPRPQEDMSIDDNRVGPRYFATLRIPILAGRDFSREDRAGAPRVCIVNQTMARRFWPGQSPIGHRLNSWGQWWTVVGVARDIKYHSLNEHPIPFLYFPYLQAAGDNVHLLVRTSGAPDALLPALRHEVQAMDAGVSLEDVTSLKAIFGVSLFAWRIAALLGAFLGLIGVLLAAGGVYGVLSYSVSQRTHEIGVRMALGASWQKVVLMIVGQGLRQALRGIAAGLLGALFLVRFLTSLLYGVRPVDPVTFLAAPLLLLGMAFMASLAPAVRAARVDPILTLRHDALVK